MTNSQKLAKNSRKKRDTDLKTSKQLVSCIHRDGAYSELRFWKAEDIAEWIFANYYCTKKTAHTAAVIL